MPAELVMADYLRSNEGLDLFRAEMRRKFRLFLIVGPPRRRFLPLLEARREYLQAALEQINRSYGGLDDYARRGLGLSEKDRLGLNRLFLEETSPPPPQWGVKETKFPPAKGAPSVGG